jgi:hypothetical protein
MPIVSRRNFLSTTACTAVALTAENFTIIQAAQAQDSAVVPFDNA